MSTATAAVDNNWTLCIASIYDESLPVHPTGITILHTHNMKIGTMICILLVPISIRNVNIRKFVRRA